MALRFTLDVSGDVQMDRTLEAVNATSGQIDSVLRDIGKDLRRVTDQQFKSEGRYASGATGWPALSDAYLKRKRAMVAQGKVIHGRPARHMQILRLTDRLRESLLSVSDPEHVESIHNHTLLWGTSVPYARYHQNPGKGPRAMKRRRFLELPESTRQKYARAILTYVRTGKSGL